MGGTVGHNAVPVWEEQLVIRHNLYGRNSCVVFANNREIPELKSEARLLHLIQTRTFSKQKPEQWTKQWIQPLHPPVRSRVLERCADVVDPIPPTRYEDSSWKTVGVSVWWMA